MKNAFILVVLLITTLSYSQKKKRIIYSEDSEIKVVYNKTDKNKLAEMVVNDTFVGFLDKNISNAIDSNKIEKIEVKKNKLGVKDYAGGVIITMKSYYTPKFITIKNLIDKYLDLDKNPIMFQVNNNIVNQDYNKFKIDENFILKIELSKIKTSEENRYINLVKIITKTAENIKKANEIRLR